MCGIGAFQIVNSEVDPSKVARVLLRLLEQRGQDASGVAWHDNGDTYLCKDNCAGKQLAKRLPSDVGATGIVHTRWATKGDPANNLNNHPIDVGGLIGVHNGHISNDDALIALAHPYERQAQVDSEALFAVLAHAPEGWSLEDRVEQVRGNCAMLWLESYDSTETLHGARLTTSPLWFGQTVSGSFLFASTLGILKETAHRCDMDLEYIHEVPEGTYVRCQAGILTEMKALPIPEPLFTYGRTKHLPDYSRPSAFSNTRLF
jgi:glucosamine--fructose-6-phosphate aminotransferase (isomerizing)